MGKRPRDAPMRKDALVPRITNSPRNPARGLTQNWIDERVTEWAPIISGEIIVLLNTVNNTVDTV